MEKGQLYRLTESLIPPILWRFFKRTRLYRAIARRADSFTSPPPIENITISSGDFSGITLRLFSQGGWQKEMLSGNYDSELFTYLKKFSWKNKIIYDVGAHIGFHSLAFARMVGDQGQVITFEPNPANLARLNENLELNQELKLRIKVLEMALGEKTGTTKFFCSNDIEGGSSSGGFSDSATTIWERSVYTEQIAFKTITVLEDSIDRLVTNNILSVPALLKIDVEGAEQNVLTGAEKTIQKYRPLILVEFHSTFSAYACMKILLKLGYTDTILKHEPDGRLMIAAK